MAPAVFSIHIDPNVIRKGDKIRIKGILTDDAKEFSINFVNEHCSNPAFITYHFKWLLDIPAIVENYKDNGMWINHQEQDFDGIRGSTFELEFTFHDEQIHVYRIYHNTPNYITTYEPFFSFSQIKALQVWGDVKKITELTFRYAA